MTYGDQYPRAEHGTGATPHQARWSWAVVCAVVAVVGLAFYGISARWGGQKSANPPAVVAAPAPATGVAPPLPQTTTGQALPAETTGRGGNTPAGSR
jgi:hypothetical protein